MKNWLYLPTLLLMFALSGCTDNAGSNQSTENELDTVAKYLDTEAHSPSDSSPEEGRDWQLDAVLEDPISMTKKAFMSGGEQEEVLTLTVPSGKIFETMSVLEIKSGDGKSLYTEKFSTAAFINGYNLAAEIDGREGTTEDTEKHVIKRINSMFDDANFMDAETKVLEDEEQVKNAEDQLDMDTWDVVKATSEKEIAYLFYTGTENLQYLVYNKELMRVMVLYTCC